MKNNDFIMCGVFYDKHQFEQAREILEKAGIEFWASNKAPSVNFRVPGAAFTEIELHVAKENLEKVEALFADIGEEE